MDHYHLGTPNCAPHIENLSRTWHRPLSRTERRRISLPGGVDPESLLVYSNGRSSGAPYHQDAGSVGIHPSPVLTFLQI